MTRYYHLYADGKTVKEITQAEYFAIRRRSLQLRGWHKKTARVHIYKDKIEIALSKGANYVYVTMRQIEELGKC